MQWKLKKLRGFPDINGKWQLSEIRQNIPTQEAKDRKIEERVFGPMRKES